MRYLVWNLGKPSKFLSPNKNNRVLVLSNTDATFHCCSRGSKADLDLRFDCIRGTTTCYSNQTTCAHKQFFWNKTNNSSIKVLANENISNACVFQKAAVTKLLQIHYFWLISRSLLMHPMLQLCRRHTIVTQTE